MLSLTRVQQEGMDCKSCFNSYTRCNDWVHLVLDGQCPQKSFLREYRNYPAGTRVWTFIAYRNGICDLFLNNADCGFDGKFYPSCIQNSIVKAKSTVSLPISTSHYS